ncbi:MAG: deoxyguanosinetriphosphate triphosphohydrolase [Monoglobales bacterium]
MTIREITEKNEHLILSDKAAFADSTKGREFPVEPCDLRTDYQRDRDKIIHSKSFRRLKHKTQVFIIPDEDHFRTRLTHTLEVSQIARTIGRGLRLNEDLIEAISLGHDLGHTPFGHSGERALQKLNPEGFEHNVHSLRIVDRLENGCGLNLTYEVRDGLLNHRTNCMPETYEGRVVRIADKIAYINHDIDDALRSGMISHDDLPKRAVTVLGDNNGKRINTLVNDLVLNNLQFTPEVKEAMDELRAFMFERVYNEKSILEEEVKVHKLIGELYSYYKAFPDKIPGAQRLDNIDSIDRLVTDYIAGMTDEYAINTFEKLFLPKPYKKDKK